MNQRIIECRASGLSVKVWCEQNYWNTSTYYRWEREIFGRVKKSAAEETELVVRREGMLPASTRELVEVPVVETAASPSDRPNAQPAFCPVAVVRIDAMELSLTNAVSPKLMKHLKELFPHAE